MPAMAFAGSGRKGKAQDLTPLFSLAAGFITSTKVCPPSIFGIDGKGMYLFGAPCRVERP